MNINWFEAGALRNFDLFLKEYRNKPNIHFLQIGVFKGHCSLWLFENILTHESSTLTDVDCWGLVDSRDALDNLKLDWEDVEAKYDKKLLPYKDRLNKHKAMSKEWLLQNRSNQYDLIYIDGDHTPKGFMTDAVLSWDLLKTGGIMAIDDYTWPHPDGGFFSPKSAIDMFMHMVRNESQVMANNNQVWLRKTSADRTIY